MVRTQEGLPRARAHSPWGLLSCVKTGGPRVGKPGRGTVAAYKAWGPGSFWGFQGLGVCANT